MNDIVEVFKKYIPTLIRGIILSIIAYIVLKIIKFLIRRILNNTKLDKTIVKFLMELINPFLYILFIYAILVSFKFPVLGLTGIIAALGLSLSLALKDTITDIANGITILISKPFKVGDYIELNEYDGTVDVIGLMLTVLITPDKRKIFIPNTTVSSSTVINYTSLNVRRLEMEFHTSFLNDIDYTKKIIFDTVMENDMVMKDLKPIIFVDKIDNYTLNFSVRVYCKTDDYWDLKWEMSEIIWQAFKKNGIIVPYNRIDIKIVE